MSEFNKEELSKEYDSHNDEKEIILNDLKNCIISSNGLLEGNTFYVHLSLKLYPELYKKQVNLFWCGKQASTRICEIGFNAGHSTMLMLLGREKTPLNFTVFDIGEHPYTKNCLEYIKNKFDNVNFEYIEGDSIVTMPKWIKENPSSVNSFDVVHIDGGHSENCIKNDMLNSDLLVKLNGIIIIDDTNMNHINNYVDLYLLSGKYKELDVIKTTGYPHRIIRKIH
jgi:hypothetical protein